MTVDELVDKVVSGIKPEWDTLHRIRYVYIEVGKALSRDTDFFYSIDNKLEESNMSVDEIKRIYESSEGRNLAVICRSAALILKKVYDKLGIESWLVRSNNNFQELIRDSKTLETIYHWFLAVKDGDKVYFLTLNTDLPNIQMGFETQHFGTPIQYMREVQGKKIQVYQGEKINETVIPRNVLFQVDKDIGYVRHSYNYDRNFRQTKEYTLQYDDSALAMLRDAVKGEKIFLELERYETPFYKELNTFIGADGKEKTLLGYGYQELTQEDWEIWKKIFCQFVINKIEELLGRELDVIPYVSNPQWNYDAWLFRLCSVIQDDLFKMYNTEGIEDLRDVRVDVENFNYKKWSLDLKKKFNIKSKNYDYHNILLLMDRMNALLEKIGPHFTPQGFKVMFDLINYNFIPAEHIYENNIDENGMLSNSYIANKFEKVFAKVFGCNEGIDAFNRMGYSEQIVVIKRILEILFPEITYDNSCRIEDYNGKYTPVANRIHIYPIKRRDNGEYAVVFNILGESRYDDYYFLYDLRTNTFGVCDIFDISMDYIIISDRMRDRMNAEDVEYFGTQKK